MQRRRGKEKEGQPLERLSSPQSQPGTAVFLLAQQPNCPPAVPAPAPERRGNGIPASPSATLAASFSPHPGTVQPASRDAVQAAGWRRRMRGEALSSSQGSVASRVGEEALHPHSWAPAEGWGGLWGWQHPSRFPAPAEGDGMCREDGCSAATRQRWRKHGRAGRAARPRQALPGWWPGGHAGRTPPRVSPLPSPPRRELGDSQNSARRCTRHSPEQGQVALGSRHPPQIENPPPAHRD